MVKLPKGLFSIAKVFKAFRYALEGIVFAFKNERAFCQELLSFVPLAIVAIFISNSILDYLLLVIPFFFILALELVNTAVEQLADLISKERCPEIKIAKDCAAGAVLLMVFATATIWLVKLSSFL